MKTTCIECHQEIDVTEQLQRHKCGLLNVLVPDFPYDSKYLTKKYGKKVFEKKYGKHWDIFKAERY